MSPDLMNPDMLPRWSAAPLCAWTRYAPPVVYAHRRNRMTGTKSRMPRLYQKRWDTVGEIGGSFGGSHPQAKSDWAASLGIRWSRHDVPKLLDLSAHAPIPFDAFLRWGSSQGNT
jgi:hypothetical protein